MAVLQDLARPSDQDCCVWVRHVLRWAYGAEVIDAVPTWRSHLVVEEGAGPWEPFEAARDAGIAISRALSQGSTTAWRGVVAPAARRRRAVRGGVAGQPDGAGGLRLHEEPRMSGPIDGQLNALAAWLHSRRDTILEAWESVVASDPQIRTPMSMSRRQLQDHVPEALDNITAALRARVAHTEPAVVQHGSATIAHGQHRWQHGYQLAEMMREWGHLQLCLLDELEQYEAAHPDFDSGARQLVRRLLTGLCSEAVTQSTARFVDLQQKEAAASLQELRRLSEGPGPLESTHADLLRGTAHDLRGGLGIVRACAATLVRADVPPQVRQHLYLTIERALESQQGLVDGLIELSRLQAGKERRRIVEFDAARMLDELATTCQELANARGLTLTAEGPRPLVVQGDPLRVRRIAQNLLLNALTYTEVGGVDVTWDDCPSDPQRWTLSVADTGPGFDPPSSGPLTQALEEGTAQASGRAPHPHSPSGPKGEGIGLAIVKRLCDLLDASLELQGRSGGGSVFRVTLPRRYSDPPTGMSV